MSACAYNATAVTVLLPRGCCAVPPFVHLPPCIVALPLRIDKGHSDALDADCFCSQDYVLTLKS